MTTMQSYRRLSVTYQKNIRDNTTSMAQKAFEIRSQYLSADGRKYDPEFETWWSDYKLDTIFGKRANFTKWASAGAALSHARIGEYRDRMPTTLTALYEVSQLTPEELKLCMQDRFTRESLTDQPKGRKAPVVYRLDVVAIDPSPLTCCHRLFHAINCEPRDILKSFGLCGNPVFHAISRVHIEFARCFLRLVQILCFRGDANPSTAVLKSRLPFRAAISS